MQVKRFILIQTARHLCHRHATTAHLYKVLAVQEADQAHYALFLCLAAKPTSWPVQIWYKFLVQHGWAVAWLIMTKPKFLIAHVVAKTAILQRMALTAEDSALLDHLTTRKLYTIGLCACARLVHWDHTQLGGAPLQPHPSHGRIHLDVLENIGDVKGMPVAHRLPSCNCSRPSITAGSNHRANRAQSLGCSSYASSPLGCKA